MIVGGSLYLLNLAKNYSSDDSGTQVMQILFQLLLIVEYIALMYLCNINIGKNISELVNLVTRDQQVPQSYYAQLKLKLWQIKRLRVIVMVFFIHEIFHGTYWMITVDILGDPNEYSRVVLNLCLEYFKLIYYSALLWVFRPRRNWPEHYGVGIDNLMRRSNNSRKNEVQTPIETIEINDSDMADEPI